MALSQWMPNSAFCSASPLFSIMTLMEALKQVDTRKFECKYWQVLFFLFLFFFGISRSSGFWCREKSSKWFKKRPGACWKLPIETLVESFKWLLGRNKNLGIENIQNNIHFLVLPVCQEDHPRIKIKKMSKTYCCTTKSLSTEITVEKFNLAWQKWVATSSRLKTSCSFRPSLNVEILERYLLAQNFFQFNSLWEFGELRMLQKLITKNLKKNFSGLKLNSNFSTEVKLSKFCWFIGNLLLSLARLGQSSERTFCFLTLANRWTLRVLGVLIKNFQFLK